MQPTVATRRGVQHPLPSCRQRISKLQPDGSAIKCLFSDGASLTLSRFLAGFIRPSDQIEFDPTAADPDTRTPRCSKHIAASKGTLLRADQLCDTAKA